MKLLLMEKLKMTKQNFN